MSRLMQGKICLLTGGTAGIGKATALGLADLGATVIIVGRNPDKGRAVIQEITQETGNSALTFLTCDLSSQASIRRLAGQIQQHYPHLDVLLNNAGVFQFQRKTSADGLEMTFAVNHLAPFLLTHLLLNTLKASAPARIINVSSDAHQSASINLQDLQGEQKYGSWHAYGQSKLALVLWTYEQARRLEGSGVTVNALHPGMVATTIGQHDFGPIVQAIAKMVLPLIGTTPEIGAKTSLYLASSPDVAQISGKYFAKAIPRPSAPLSYDETLQKKIWEISAHLVGLSE